MMGCWCDEHDCKNCPGSKPGGPCWGPVESVVLETESEMEYWDVRCAAEDRDLGDEERQLLDAIDADLTMS